MGTLSQGQSKLGQEVAALKADAPHVPAVSAEVRTGSQAKQQAADSSPAHSADSISAAGVPNSGPGGKDGRSSSPAQPILSSGTQAGGDLVKRMDALASEVNKSPFCCCKPPVSKHGSEGAYL